MSNTYGHNIRRYTGHKLWLADKAKLKSKSDACTCGRCSSCKEDKQD